MYLIKWVTVQNDFEHCHLHAKSLLATKYGPLTS